VPKIKVKQFKQDSAHRQTDGHTDATKRILAPAVRSISSSTAAAAAAADGVRVIKTMTSSYPLTCVDLLSDGATLVVGSSHGHILVYDLRKQSYTVHSQLAHQSAVSRLCFSSNSPVSSKVSRWLGLCVILCTFVWV